MADEKKPEGQQAPADAPKAEEKKIEEVQKATGLDSLKPEDLKALYAKSPEMFEGIVPTPKEEKKVEPEPKKSAAPTLGDVEIKLPTDVPVDRAALDTRLALAKELGLSAGQFQRQLDHEVEMARKYIASQKQPTPQEQDAANVAKLKTEFGGSYEANIEIARQAAAKFGDPDLLEKLKTSDPVLIRHFLKLGKADADDKTPNKGLPRNGNEEDEVAKSEEQRQKSRYPNSPEMFPTR